MWKSYELPKNVDILTFQEFKDKKINPKDIVMIRGLREDYDFEAENKVAISSKNNFGINKLFYIFSEEQEKDISSSKARKSAETLNLNDLSKCVSPLVMTAMLKKVLKIKDIYLFVGPPGGGKSTILKELAKKIIMFM